MTRFHRILLALLSALLLTIPFYQWGTGLLLMVAFVPLLFIEEQIAARKRERAAMRRGGGSRTQSRPKQRTGSVIWYAALAFAVFNILTSYWVKHAAWIGIIASTLVGTIYMTLVFWLFHYTRRRLGDRLGYASLVFYWITFEFLYLRAQINFPWLVLGNAFANDISLIQWYEVTGHLGGTLWALLLNIAVFSLLRGALDRRGNAYLRSRLGWILGLFLIPVAISLFRFISYEEREDPYEIVILQPNIDPYMKFIEMPQHEQTTILLRLADSLVTPSTDYIVGPETFINNNVWESTIGRHEEVVRVKEFLDRYPKAKMVLGATTYKVYKDPSEFTSTSRPLRGSDYRYDSFNSAFQLDSTGRIPIYHKSMLVVGVEHMPYTHLLGFLQKLTVRLGGAFRSHGTQDFREAFESPQDGTRVGPVICWESIFGEFVTEYVEDAGANFLFIITNDGWWKDTPGHRQHNMFARLRAIETRRSIARSANTGISSVINQKGVELARRGWWERTGLKGTLNKNDHLTFYVKHGDYIGRISGFLTVILLLYALVIPYIRKYR